MAREFNINWSYLDEIGGQPVRFNVNEGFSGNTATSDNPVSVGQLPYAVPLYGALEVRDGRIQRPIVQNVEGQTVIDKIRGNNIAATLSYLDEQNKATLLASPRVAVEDGEEANFESVTQVPFISSTSIFNNGGFNNNINNTNILKNQ